MYVYAEDGSSGWFSLVKLSGSSPLSSHASLGREIPPNTVTKWSCMRFFTDITVQNPALNEQLNQFALQCISIYYTILYLNGE